VAAALQRPEPRAALEVSAVLRVSPQSAVLRRVLPEQQVEQEQPRAGQASAAQPEQTAQLQAWPQPEEGWAGGRVAPEAQPLPSSA